MQEGIGSTWYYVENTAGRHAAPVYETKTAQVIAETPRKWILRESEAIERAAQDRMAGYTRETPPGESWSDWTISKKGEASREGRGKRNATRVFVQRHELAESTIAERLEAAWAYENAYKIAQRIRHVTVEDPALLRKVAELIGYKENGV